MSTLQASTYKEIHDALDRIKGELSTLHRIVGSHHSGMGIRNALEELAASQSWLRMSMSGRHEPLQPSKRDRRSNEGYFLCGRCGFHKERPGKCPKCGRTNMHGNA